VGRGLKRRERRWRKASFVGNSERLSSNINTLAPTEEFLATNKTVNETAKGKQK